jgi:hypothetical protein
MLGKGNKKPLIRRCQSAACRESLALIEDGSLRMTRGTVLAVDADCSLTVRCMSCDAVTMMPWGRQPKGSWVRPALVTSLPRPAIEDVIALMEERWEAFRITKLRQRGTIAVGLRFDVFMRDGFRCRYCGVSVDDGAILHADHLTPESRGGPTNLDNLVTACIDCNLGKSDKILSKACVC